VNVTIMATDDDYRTACFNDSIQTYEARV
jgi:hypothetical protein